MVTPDEAEAKRDEQKLYRALLDDHDLTEHVKRRVLEDDDDIMKLLAYF